MIKAYSSLFVLLVTVFNFTTYAQSTSIPLNRTDYQWIDRMEIRSGQFAPDFNSFNKGISRDQIATYILALDSENIKLTNVDRKNLQWLYNDNDEYCGDNASNNSNYALFNLFYSKTTDLYSLSDSKLDLKVNPVLFYQGGGASANSVGGLSSDPHFMFYNTRGIEIRGNFLKRLGFYSYIGENQWSAPAYVKEYTNKYLAVPGVGYYKLDNKLNGPLKFSGVDFLDARGYITFSALKNIVRFSFGQDKVFLGYGMRSLFLSDNSNSQLFLKVSTHYGKFDYQNIFTQLIKQHDPTHGDFLYPKKFAAFHHLNFNLTNKVKIGVYEGVIFSRNNQYELQYLVPVVFYRQVEQALGSPDNAVMGADASVLLFKHFELYGQFLLDEFNFNQIRANRKVWTNKNGIQAGLKYVNVFGIANLDATAEINIVRPYTYSHRDSLANYTHYNQALAHPSGANFKEVCGKVHYQPVQRFTVTYSFAVQSIGLDTANSDWGQNPLISYNNRPSRFLKDNGDAAFSYNTGGGVNTKIFVADLVVSYQFAHNMYLDLNYIHRTQQAKVSSLNRLEDYYGIGVRLNFARNAMLF